MTHRVNRLRAFSIIALLMLFVQAGCDSNKSGTDLGLDQASCTFDIDTVVSGGVGIDGIPSLDNPLLVGPDDQGASYLDDDSRVVGVVMGNQAIAVPHNILWWHEIVNLDAGGEQIAISYCPLTGSSIAFDRAPFNGATFGVSGLLYQNNLIMYNRGDPQASLWPQLLRKAGCGPRADTPLPQIAMADISWSAWKAIYPSTFVISNDTGFSRVYTASGYPYGSYETLNSADVLFPQRVNTDRPPKERGLGIPDGTGGRLYPFLELDVDPVTAVNDMVNGQPVAVFWSRDANGAMVFARDGGGMVHNFTVVNGEIQDVDSGSVWNLAGRALSGPLAGTELTPIPEAYVAFWFAWKAFHPDITVWTNVE